MSLLGEAFGQVGGLVRTAPTLTRHSRLRHQIRAALDLRERALAQKEGLDSTIEDLAVIINFQTRRLSSITTQGTSRTPQWGASGLALLVTLGCAALAYFLGIRSLPEWWGYLVAVVAFFATALFLLVSIAALLTRGPSRSG